MPSPLITPNHYERLDVLKTATVEEITQAYRKKALALHPDKIRQKGGTAEEVSQATEEFKALQESYEILRSAETRSAYDKSQENRTEVIALPVPEGMERSSKKWRRIKDIFVEQYKQQELKPIPKKEFDHVMSKTNPLQSTFFSSLIYQNYYTFATSSSSCSSVEESKENDQRFSDVFALIEEKSRQFGESQTDISFVKKPLTPEIAHELLHYFLKGRYYGQTLNTIQDYLKKEIQNTERVISKSLYVAILQFISIKNLKLEHQTALDAIHALYTAAFQDSQAQDRAIAVIKHVKRVESIDYEKALADVNGAKELLEKIETNYEKASEKAKMYQVRIEELTAAIQHKKETLSASAGANHAIVDELDGLTSQRHTTMNSLENIREECDPERAIILREDAYKTVLRLEAILAPLQKRIAQLQQEIEALTAKKINSPFLDVLHSNYFKLTLATIISYYWQDSKPIVTQELLMSMTIGLNRDNPKQYNAFGQVLYYADQRLAEIATGEPSPERYYEYAEFFIDLSHTMPGMIKLHALMNAGLCFQLASHMHETEQMQMVAETLALRVYQIALTVAAKLPASQSMYATTHVTKFLSEFKFDQTTLTLEDLEKLVSKFHGRYQEISPSYFELFSVHSGSPLQSMEGAIEKTFYLISGFPSYSHLTSLMDQVQRQSCYMNYMDGLITKFSQTLDARDVSERIEPKGDLAEPYYYRYEQALLSREVSAEELSTRRMESMLALLDQSRTSLFELNQFMNAPYIAMPQDAQGWWLPGPLNYPHNSEELGLVIYKSFDGYYYNETSGEIRLLLTRWMPGDRLEDKLFTHDDLIDLVKGGVGQAVFSLDANSAFRKFDPLQVVRFSPSRLRGTEYLRRLFGADYLMKELSQGMQIQGEPPYNTKPIDSLLEGIDESVKHEILIAANTAPEQEQQATRFWIQMGEIPRCETHRGYGVYVQYGDPDVMVKKQLLTLDANGDMVDAPINVDDKSREAKFAHALTKHYKTLSSTLPVLKLEQFYKITACIQELQTKRVDNSELTH